MVVGRYHLYIFEGQATEIDVETDARVRVATEDDLENLSPLLVPDIDHAHRIQEGDVCLYVLSDYGEPMGVQWANFGTHQDAWMGKWSKPSPDVAYINQAYVDESVRGRGYGGRLMLGTIALGQESGRTRFRTVVDGKNKVMKRIMEGMGFYPIAHQWGFRLGPRFTLRYTRAMSVEQ